MPRARDRRVVCCGPPGVSQGVWPTILRLRKGEPVRAYAVCPFPKYGVVCAMGIGTCLMNPEPGSPGSDFIRQPGVGARREKRCSQVRFHRELGFRVRVCPC